MKMNLEILIGVIILMILGIFLNPTHLLMPDTLNTMLGLGLIIGFLGFVGLVWQEQGADERDIVHIHKSGRISFLVGATILVVGIISQTTSHEVDPWLLLGLSGMVLTKIVARVIHQIRN